MTGWEGELPKFLEERRVGKDLMTLRSLSSLKI
jgi:hypothetical protein